MAGIFVAIAALCLGVGGPRFRWRGALAIMCVMIAAGLFATMDAAHEADEAGLVFVVTPGSVAAGLAGQIAFTLLFYGVGLAIWKGLALVAPRPPAVPEPPKGPDAA